MTIIDEAPTDADLVARVRAGDTEAYGELWSRHVEVARGLARRITSRDPEDLIGESYARILTAIQAGRGPETAFRPYLMSTIRRVNIDNARRYQARVVPTDNPEVLDRHSSESSEDLAVRRAEGSSAMAAWRSLPPETRDLLWDLVVMDETPGRLSGKLGMSPNAVASRARRARERLRQAYLSQLVTSSADDECQLVRSDLGAYVRGSLGATRRETIEEHLETCVRCRGAVADLRSVDDMIRLRIVPFLPVVALGAAHELSVVGSAASVTTATKKALAALKPQLARVPALNGPAGFVAAASSLAAAVAISALVLTSGPDDPAPTAKAPQTSSASTADRAGFAKPVAITAATPVALPVATTVARGAALPQLPAMGRPRAESLPKTLPVPERDVPPRPGASPAPVPSAGPAPVVPRPPVSSPPMSSPPMSSPPVTHPEPHADDDEQGDQGGQGEHDHSTGSPAPATPSGPVTIALSPGATSTTLTKLRVPKGWVITAVSTLSDHPSNQNAHLPTRSFVGFVEPGPVTVVVTRTAQSAPSAPSAQPSQSGSGGSLEFEFVARGGKLAHGRHSLP